MTKPKINISSKLIAYLYLSDEQKLEMRGPGLIGWLYDQ